MEKTSLLYRLQETEKLLEDQTTENDTMEQLKELAADLRVAVAKFSVASLHEQKLGHLGH